MSARRFSKKKDTEVMCELGVHGYGGLIIGSVVDNKVAEPLIDEWKHSWHKGTLTYKLLSYTNDWKSRYDQERV